MNGERLKDLLSGISDMALRAEVEQFAIMDQDEQLVHMYLKVHRSRPPIGWPHALQATYTTAAGMALAYLMAGAPLWPGG